MKKIIFILVAMLGIASANAQFKDSGFKVIGEVGSNVTRMFVDGGGDGFGIVAPGAEVSLGTNVCPNFFVGGGVGYDAWVSVGDLKDSMSDTYHEIKAFAHGRYYMSAEGNGLIADVKLGYKRNLSFDLNQDAFDIFVGPGYMFGGKFTVTAGYSGSFHKEFKLHGAALKFGMEF